MLIVDEALRQKIVNHAREGLPNESCGLFAGTIEGDTTTIREVYCLRNIDARPDHFSMAPEEQFAAIADMRKKDFVLLGNFHSHPATPARPSEEDMRLAFDDALSYIIVSLQDGGEDIKSFKIDRQQNCYTEEVIKGVLNG
jgi:proteasome lid subunit RPN8/RPN11